MNLTTAADQLNCHNLEIDKWLE